MESPEPFLPDPPDAEPPDVDARPGNDPTRWQYWLEDADEHLSQAIAANGSAVQVALERHEAESLISALGDSRLRMERALARVHDVLRHPLWDADEEPF